MNADYYNSEEYRIKSAMYQAKRQGILDKANELIKFSQSVQDVEQGLWDTEREFFGIGATADEAGLPAALAAHVPELEDLLLRLVKLIGDYRTFSADPFNNPHVQEVLDYIAKREKEKALEAEQSTSKDVLL